MAGDVLDTKRPAQDAYAEYYAEKLWHWIPEYYRDADFNAARPDVLRALVEVVAGDAAVARRSIDRLWEDVLIDYADDWAVPYIGELIGARLLGSLNARGARVDVAKTVSYRRRAGTPVVLDQLIRDITGWGGAVSEAYSRLHRYWHGLDCGFAGEGIAHLATARHGFANLRAQRIAERVDTAFDEYAHRPDFRRHRGSRGRYAIPKLNLRIYRQKPVEIRDPMGEQLGSNWFTFDPSGRDVALFANNRARDAGEWRPPRIWNMPAPVEREELNHAVFAISEETDLSDFGPNLDAMTGSLVEGVERLLELSQFDSPASFGEAAFRALQADTAIAECAKYQHYGTAMEIASGTVVTMAARAAEEVMSADLQYQATAPAFPTGVMAFIDPELGRIYLERDHLALPLIYHYGQFEHVGAGGYDRDGSVEEGANLLPSASTGLTPITISTAGLTGLDEFTTSKKYELDAPISGFTQLRLQATNFERPYVMLPPQPGGGLTSIISPEAPAPATAADDPANLRTLDLEGLWLSVRQTTPTVRTLTDPVDPVAPQASTIVIDATAAPIERVCISHCTLDPGGERGRLRPCEATVIPYVRLEIRGHVEELIIDRSIVGPIEEETASGDRCSVGKLIIRDSIVHSIDPAQPAIGLKSGILEIERSTVFGEIAVSQLHASELLATGLVRAIDNQNGCFRFSAAPILPATRLPRQYQSHLYAEGIAPHVFVSQRFGDAGYAQLSKTAPAEIVTGGENASEIGVFNSTLAPILARDLAAKLDEYTPINTIAQLIFEN